MHAVLFLLLFVVLVTAGDTHNVTVGQEGSFFNPAVVAAQEGDIVQFIFSGDSHGVVQADQYAPCTPKDGGFNSGLAGRNGNFSAEAPIWRLYIDDASQPIWYYCPSLNPSSHCNSGMVGVINPPDVNAYQDFVNLAKIYPVSTSVTTSPTVALSGSGAHATASPAVLTPTSLFTSSIPSSSTSSSSTFNTAIPAETSPSTPSSSSSSSTNIGAIVGGVVGGLAGVAILILLSIYGTKYLKHSRRESRHFFEYQGNTPVMEQHHQERGPSLEQPSTIASLNQPQAQPRQIFSLP